MKQPPERGSGRRVITVQSSKFKVRAADTENAESANVPQAQKEGTPDIPGLPRIAGRAAPQLDTEADDERRYTRGPRNSQRERYII